MGTWCSVSKVFVFRRFNLTYNDDNGDRVEVGENVVGDTTEVHGSAHLSQVGVHLTVCQPENGHPEEYRAGSESTGNLVNPGIVKVVPAWGVGSKCGWLDSVPHGARVPVPPRLHGVGRHATTESLEKELERWTHDVSARGSENVELLADNKDRQSDDEHDGGKKVSEPEADVSLSVNHANLTNQGTDVDEEVEPVVDTGDSDGGVDNDALVTTGLHAHLLLGNLLGDEWRDVGLECSRSETHDDETENEDTKSSV